MLFRNKEKGKRIAHIGAAVVILLHAYEKYDSGHESWLSFGIAGLVFLAIALLHPMIEKKAPWVDGVFFAIEAVLSLIVAFEFFQMGKKALPATYLFLAGLQFFIAFRMSKKGIEHHKATH